MREESSPVGVEISLQQRQILRSFAIKSHLVCLPAVHLYACLHLSSSCIQDGHPVMAAGSPVGHIGLWDLEEKKPVCQMRDAHSTAIAGLTFLHGEPLLLTNGADNAIRVR